MLHFIKRELDIHIPIIHRDLLVADLVSMEVHELFKRVREISAMWICPRTYFDVFSQEPNVQWTYQKDGCAACMLARLGGEPNVLVALKAAMIARSRTNAISSSRRHVYLDSLIVNGFVAGEAKALMHRAIRLGAEIRYHWRTFLSKQREKRRDEDAAAAAVKDKGKGNAKVVATLPTEADVEDIYGDIYGDIYEDIYEDIDNVINEYQQSRPDHTNDTSHSSQGSFHSVSASSIYTYLAVHPPTPLNPRIQPGKSFHKKSYSNNTPYRGANSYALSYQNALHDSAPYQRGDKGKGKGKERLEMTMGPSPKRRPQIQVSPPTPKKSPADSESTTWGGFLEQVYRVQGKDKGKQL
jgi:hypothetical protein